MKAFGSEKDAIEAFSDKNDAAYAIGRTQAIYSSWNEGFWRWFFIGAWVGMMYFAARLYQNGGLTVGSIFTYLMYNYIVIAQVM